MSTPLAPPGLDDVHIWQVSLDVGSDELEALAAVLTPDERERASRFVQPCDAARSAAARGHLRQLLGGYLACPAAEVRLGAGRAGKPYVTNPGANWLRFNMSHSGDQALIGVANGREVGVDIERVQPELADPSLAGLFTPAEQRTLASLTRDEYVRQCFWLWTRKEAVVKGLGIGLMAPLDGVDVLDDHVLLKRNLNELLSASTAQWNVRSLNLGVRSSAAVAVQAPSASTHADHVVQRRIADRDGDRRQPAFAQSGNSSVREDLSAPGGRVFRSVAKVSGSLLIATAASAAAATPASAAPPQGTVVVVHGLRGIVADVSVDGAVVMRGFAPSRVSDGLHLPAGPHTITIQRSGAAPGSAPLVTQRVDVPADAETALVAGLSESGSPVLTAYSDQPGSFNVNGSSIVIRNAASVPTSLPVLDGQAVAAAIAASHEVTLPTAPGEHTLSLKVAQGGAPLVGTQKVPVTPGMATVLYLTGSSKNATLGWLAVPVKLASTRLQPHTVKTGNSGLAAERPGVFAPAGSTAAPLAWLGALALAGMSWSALRLRSRRRAFSTCD